MGQASVIPSFIYLLYEFLTSDKNDGYDYPIYDKMSKLVYTDNQSCW